MEPFRKWKAASKGGGAVQENALAFLVAGQPDRAVLALENLALENPRDATVRSDLAAAYLARAQSSGNREDFVRALAAASEGVRLDDTLEAAAFNRALALEKLYLREGAAEAWQRHQDLDATSGWSVEAKERLGKLVHPAFWKTWETERRRLESAEAADNVSVARDISFRFPQLVREHVEVQTLGAWGDGYARGRDADSERALRLARTTADALKEKTHDALLADAVAVVRRASAGFATSLARGHRIYRDARSHYDALDFEGAAPLFAQAQRDLEEGGSPFALWAEFYRGVCAYPRGEHAAALEIFERLTRDPRIESYPVLGGYAFWMSGLLSANQGRLGESLGRYRRALDLFTASRQDQNVATIHSLLANDFAKLGARRLAWEHVLAALAGSDRVLKRRWAVTILQQAATLAIPAEEAPAALEFQSEAVRIARGNGNPLVLAEALVARSLGRQRLGSAAAARRDLQEARQWMSQVPEGSSMRAVVAAQLEMAQGKLLRGTDPAAAAEALTAAAELHARRGARVLLTAIHVERGRAHLALGRADLAEEDFRLGIEDFERQRREAPGEDLRISYFEQAREVFDEMIRLQVDEGRDPRQALELAERARGRELLDAVMRQERTDLPSAWTAPGRLAHLPEDLALVEYTVLPDRLLIWVLRRRGVDFVQQPVGIKELQLRVEAWRRTLRNQVEDTRDRTLAAGLHDLLVRPVAGFLPQGGTLVFLPDKALHDLPFAALFDKASGHRLIEDHGIAVAPSAALVLHGMSTGGEASPFAPLHARRVLAVGNPRFDRRWYPDLGPLSGASQEAQRVAALYPEAQILIGLQATRTSFLAALERNEVVHLAAHAIANEEFPLLSQLVLAPEPETGESGALLAHEIRNLDLTAVHLVILAACRTARSRISPGEGVSGLARPFLAQGVPAVVASLWAVDDATSPPLFTAFHRRLRIGDSPVNALRQAQISFLRSRDPKLRRPAAWAAFQVIAGGGR